ncbi:MAG: DUF3604 domain-containing protein [Deltaproteobacteria bacterium]|nr:DUF3604 domain-containing protein [Deltaproteobacteria bacterium]
MHTLQVYRLLLALLLPSPLLAGVGHAEPGATYSPYANPHHADRVFWGDTHLHSSWSPDAGGSGNRRISPDEAYRFARGETVQGHSDQPVALRRPLDFLVVADHSEALGLFPLLAEKNPSLLSTENGRRWSAMLDAGRWGEIGLEFAFGLASGRNPFGNEEARAEMGRTMWDRVVANAERYNEPGIFTAFIGYEWSSMPDGANLHRVVVFRDGAERAGKVVPFSSIDSEDPEDLWRYLASYEKTTGGQVFAIPHNGNLSAGRMFELESFKGQSFTQDYARTRLRWEPLVEATQIKGDSEAAPFLSPDDEFADYGTWDMIRGMGQGPHEDWMYEFEYVRPALGNGLVVGRRLGVNPFEFGLIGSTDSHTGLATADDDDFWGKFSSNEPPVRDLQGMWAGFDVSPDSEMGKRLAARRDGRPLPEQMKTWFLVASGFAAVWARENTREAIFDAMKRRETYSTTGPRMVVRFFGGWSFEDDDAKRPNPAAVGYAKGTPMGGTLAERPKKASPSFLVSVARDPEGANLDRVQVVKLWVGPKGERRERIFDVAVSDGRRIGSDGRCRVAVGNTVDVEHATYQNTLGASTLTTVWRDPDFDPERRATYYLRVLEIPTPRWTTYDAARLGVELDPKIPRTTQGRAYTSPIWYTPQ